MSTIPSSSLPPAPSSAAFDPATKASKHAHAARHGAAQAPAVNADSTNAAADSSTTGLDGALARIQGQNQASALASLADLQEAMAATRSAQQTILTQSNAARAAQAGLSSAAALRVLEG